MLGILGWLAANWKTVAAGLAIVAIAAGGAIVKGKFDRAAQADAIAAQAKTDAATAKAKLDWANAQVQALSDKAKKDDADRQTADALVHEREEGYVSIIATLKKRAAAASPHDAACNYGPDALGVLNDAWAGLRDGVRDAARASHRTAPAAGAAAGPEHQP